MFPRLRERLGTALDLVVEFSTLGEYRLDAPCVPPPASATAAALGHGSELGGAGRSSGLHPARRTVAGVAAALPGEPLGANRRGAPVATPAARRLQHCRRIGPPADAVLPPRRTRTGAPPPAEQHCLAPNA